MREWGNDKNISRLRIPRAALLWGDEMNLRRLAHKLQTALCIKGERIKINQVQAYSQKAQRMVTKYVVIKTEEISSGRRKNETLLETYQLAEVVKRLAELYGGG